MMDYRWVEIFRAIAISSYLNWYMAVQIIVIGYMIGVALAILRYQSKVASALLAPVFATLRSAPSFVVMFFLLALGDREQGLFNTGFRVNGILAVVISCSVYSTIFISDLAVANFRTLKSANLIRQFSETFPGILRCFFICFLSTAAGAAVGVPEALGTALRTVNSMTSTSDRVVVLGFVAVFFATSMQICMWLIRVAEDRFVGSRRPA